MGCRTRFLISSIPYRNKKQRPRLLSSRGLFLTHLASGLYDLIVMFLVIIVPVK